MSTVTKLNVTPQPASYVANPQRLPNVDPIACCGYWMNILQWFVDERDPTLSAVDVFRKCYKFGVYEIKGGTVTPTGTLLYPEDPPIAPLIRIDRYNETVWLYQHELAAVVREDGSTFITRLD